MSETEPVSVTEEAIDDQKADEKKRKGASASKKIKVMFEEEGNCPISQFQTKLKEREIKDVELADVLKEALGQVPEAWWQTKLDELTPLEWKVKTAMEDPELRAKLSSLLASVDKPLTTERSE